MKVTVVGALCTGHGRCYGLAPELFEPDEEGYNRQRGNAVDVPAPQEDGARAGAYACPEGAITVIES